MFNVSLDVPSELAPSREPAQLDYDDFQSLVMEGCELLRETGCRLRMGGFGQDDWGLDVSYDLSAVIEQLSPTLAALRHGSEVDLDLYTQGVERTVTITPDGDVVNLLCRSRTSWTPDPENERLERRYLLGMFEKLAIDFASALVVVYPETSSVEPLARWRRGDV
jgi:hypothetical protein